MSDETYPGRAVTITIHGGRCIHSRNCVLGLPNVWKPNVQGPWVDPDAAPPDLIAAIALSCPSGAISCERHDGGSNEAAPVVNTIRVRENGPLVFHAALDVAGDGAHYRATLCRCGASRRKPYCDGSHADAGFVATGEPATQPSQPLAQRDGALKVTPKPNGPLKIDGNAELISGTGRTIDRAAELWLCRCGGSANKPYCDGTHKRNGFSDGSPQATP